MANDIGHGTGGEDKEGKVRAHKEAVMALVEQGKSDQEIAEKLDLTIEEVQYIKEAEL